MRNISYSNNATKIKNDVLQSSRQQLPVITALMMMMMMMTIMAVTFPTDIHADAVDNSTHASISYCSNACAALGTGSFCGTDGQCHFYSCRDYFAYGLEENTGISSTTNDTTTPPPELVCSPYSPSHLSDVYNGVIFGCMSYLNSIPDPNFGVNMPFNEKCSAQINEYTTFDCWQFSEVTNFVLFLSKADNANNLCTEEGDPSPEFIYLVSFGYQNSTYNGTHSATTIFVGADSTVDFDEYLATATTMYSVLTIEETKSDTPTPATAPPSGEVLSPIFPPTFATSSASSARHNYWMASSSLLLSVMKISYSLFI